ncbi:hypothetical protein ACMU_05365 [Actibacterium mucosum KCTC 23349]|uniref:Uncharacterized protein n=1 Tax=Actibacterium mucosum KCTC 23349 TaxID=1454373 RepID=A0A037ZL81_9RHOB|nr:SseB family protein [Actibacterium mucosum]KAJ56374.1 hypothetical protein ACMU_05365 [Actibacterium mucosum KCTC 23349]
MTDLTPLDHAHAGMEAAPDTAAARMRFYERLADGELFLLLEAEAQGDTIQPRLFDLESGTFALVFDRQDRLVEFTAGVAPYVALSGRAIAHLFAGQGIGLGVNLGVAPSSILLPDASVDWLVDTLAQRPAMVEARPTGFAAPQGLPQAVLDGLDAKLAAATGLAICAYLVSATYDTGAKGHLLAFVGADAGAQDPLAGAVAEALTFSGIEAGALDVAFFAADDAIVAHLDRAGLRFDLPQPEVPRRAEPVAPGSDPDKPPRLR